MPDISVVSVLDSTAPTLSSYSFGPAMVSAVATTPNAWTHTPTTLTAVASDDLTGVLGIEAVWA